MYYEYENTQKHEKQGVMKIKQTNVGVEFIEQIINCQLRSYIT